MSGAETPAFRHGEEAPSPLFCGTLNLSRGVTASCVPNPSTYQRHPLSPRPCGLCLSLLPALGTQLAVTPRDRFSVPQKRGDGASSPCLKAGVDRKSV